MGGGVYGSEGIERKSEVLEAGVDYEAVTECYQRRCFNLCISVCAKSLHQGKPLND